MKQIIQELMEPRIFSDGHIRTPTAIMLKAGKTIMNLLTIAEQDRSGRLKAEHSINILNGELARVMETQAKTNKPTVSLEEAVTAYREAINNEYLRDFT